MNKDEKGMEVSLIKGQGYEQVKVSQGAGTVPDPRVAGPSIFFDSRLDNVAKKDEPYDPLIQAVGQRQKKLGSINPDSEPAYLRGSSSSRKPPGFGKDSEALYEPESYVTDQQKLLQLTVERYNMINEFLNSFETKEKKDLAASLLQEILTLIEQAGIGHYNLLKLDAILKNVREKMETQTTLEEGTAACTQSEVLYWLQVNNSQVMVDTLKNQSTDLKGLENINELPVSKQILLLEKNADLLDSLLRQVDELDEQTVV